jgi:hypothetical protein
MPYFGSIGPNICHNGIDSITTGKDGHDAVGDDRKNLSLQSQKQQKEQNQPKQQKQEKQQSPPMEGVGS